MVKRSKYEIQRDILKSIPLNKGIRATKILVSANLAGSHFKDTLHSYMLKGWIYFKRDHKNVIKYFITDSGVNELNRLNTFLKGE